MQLSDGHLFASHMLRMPHHALSGRARQILLCMEHQQQEEAWAEKVVGGLTEILYRDQEMKRKQAGPGVVAKTAISIAEPERSSEAASTTGDEELNERIGEVLSDEGMRVPTRSASSGAA